MTLAPDHAVVPSDRIQDTCGDFERVCSADLAAVGFDDDVVMHTSGAPSLQPGDVL